MLNRIALLAITAPRRVVAVAVLVFIAAAIFGPGVKTSLSAGGFRDSTCESAQASRLLTAKFNRSDQQMIIVVTSEEGPYSAQAHPASTDPLVVVVTPDDAANSVRASEAGTDIVNHLKKVAVRFERVLGVNIA